LADHRTIELERPEDLPAAAAALDLALAMIVASDEEGRLVVRYLFEPAWPPFDDRFTTLVVTLDPARPEVPSLTRAFPAANWHEREAQDLLGVVPVGHPDPRPLVLHEGWPRGLHPLRKSFDLTGRVAREPAEEFPHLVVEGEGVFEIPVGPIHAGIIEPGHFRFSSVGETVLDLQPRLFYTHRGLEKRMVGLSATDGFFVAERICGVCSVAHGLGYCEAVEQIAGVEVPARARIVRAIALELERLYNHVGDVGNICAGASYHYGTSAGLRIKEALQQLNERVTGNRFLRGLLVPGGVLRDLPTEILRDIDAALRATEDALAALAHRIDSNPTVVDRLDDTGLLPRQAAVDLGVTGVAARASGVDRDARRDHPHAGFAEEPPRVVVLEEGDVNARRKLREAEAHEAIRLIRKLAARLEPGPLVAPLPDPLPARGIGVAAIESPRGAAIHWLRSDARGRIDRYHLRSASFANWPAVPIAAQSAIVPDFPLVNKSFELCYSCTDR
jgi:Ni,Fe-hydrogenase III large subunit/Ni,Fe-hydrogenase III component G